MAAFTHKEIDKNWNIWKLFQNGSIVLFKKNEILNDVILLLKNNNYKVYIVDCKVHKDEEALLKGIIDTLNIPRYPNISLDGFSDFISRMQYDTVGTIIVLTGFHSYYNLHPKSAISILNILADMHRLHMLTGDRLLTLIQSNNPNIDEELGNLGGIKAIWNDSEWLLSSRGL